MEGRDLWWCYTIEHVMCELLGEGIWLEDDDKECDEVAMMPLNLRLTWLRVLKVTRRRPRSFLNGNSIIRG